MSKKSSGGWVEFFGIAIFIVLFCIFACSGIYFGYRRYFVGNSAETRQAEALERIADALEKHNGSKTTEDVSRNRRIGSNNLPVRVTPQVNH